jgi:hypothetical protein
MKKNLNSCGQSKSATIKKRTGYIYLPTFKMVDKWKKRADEAGVSFSKFVIEHVENSLRQEEGEADYESRLDLIEKSKKLQEENLDLQKRCKMLDTVVERLERELREYRVKPFVDDGVIGERRFQSDLINLFKRRGVVRKDEILESLGIDPSDSIVVKGVRKQVSVLEEYGIIKDVGARWKWML